MNDQSTSTAKRLLEILGIDPNPACGTSSRVEALADLLRVQPEALTVVPVKSKGGGL